MSATITHLYGQHELLNLAAALRLEAARMPYGDLARLLRKVSEVLVERAIDVSAVER